MEVIIEQVVSEFPILITEEITTIQLNISDAVAYLDLTDVADDSYTGKDGYVPTVNESTGKLELQPQSGGSGATNLGYTPSPTDGTVTSDTGTDATLTLVDATNAGLMTPDEHTKLAGIATGADMILSSTQTVTGLKTFLAGMFGLRNVANTFTSFFTNTNTASRTYTLQDRNGILADDTDLALKLNISALSSGVLATLLTGISFATGTAVTAADTVLQGFGKLQKQITDTTTSLLSYRKNFFKITTVSSAVTGTTSETILQSILIPANTFQSGTDVDVKAIISKTGGNATSTCRIRVNTTLSLSGAPFFASIIPTLTQLYIPLKRTCIFKSATTFGTVTANGASDDVVFVSGYSIVNFNTAVDNYMIVTVEPNSALDSFVCESLILMGTK